MPANYIASDGIEYKLGATAKTVSIGQVTDTISNAITTTGSCGAMRYSWTSDNTSAGTRYMSLVDLIDGKGIRISSSTPSHVGNFTITFTVTMVDYPQFTNTTQFKVNITEPDSAIP